ncbi:MAG: signal peptidase I [Candidatus Theseobacter exili]|nr:signal peptidase I [Candidatus Theseobacter exili]
MKAHKRSVLREWTESVLFALVIAMIVRTFLIQAFKIPTGSMEPTLHGDPKKGDRVLVNKFLYRFEEPKRGDIVVFRTVNIEGLDQKKDFIKRLVGLPGDVVEIKDEKVLINGEILDEPDAFNSIEYVNTFVSNRGGRMEGQYGMEGESVTVPPGHFFVLGDNSRISRDSRYWGMVPRENLIGKAIMTYWPIKRMSLLRNM